ncbi:Lysine decarboxylase family [Olavius sp. associated proteobacterium Delta 1]|nr:Lysine decarboxylase family [Olavius sp. associated proteobacterium Delta 1]
MLSICIFCGSSAGRNSTYIGAAAKLGRLLAEKNLNLVYGGGNIGLMGEIAQGVINHGGKAIGVIPQFLVEKELVYHKLTEVHVVDSMHERKAKMAELADAFIALPGGFGTLEETVEVLTWAQLGLHRKPIGLLNIEGYYNYLNDFFDHMVAEGFLLREYKDMLLIQEDPAAMLEILTTFELPNVDKWGNLN